jgi:multidrug efflux pump subunit AcrB
MKGFFSWLERKKACLCILAAVCAVSLFVIINSNEKIKENTGGSYVVKIKHYGIDAAEMERSITIPLEDALSAIPDIMTVLSSSENSLSSVFISFKPGGRGRYEAVRDAAQKIYESLPSSVQRPEIISSNNSRVPVWSAAVSSADIEKNISAAQILEKIVKPRFESLEGTGEVLVSGVGLKEIIIILDQEKLIFLSLEPETVASYLGMNDSIFSGGTIISESIEIIITVDGRYGGTDSAGTHDISSLENALIPLGNGKTVKLSEIALITEQERTPDILSRLNGRKTAGIAIMGRHDADLRKLSGDIKKELISLSGPLNDLEFSVLSDLGAEEAAAFRSVFNAALLGAIMVAVISFLLNSGKRAKYSGFFCALAIPLICLISIAALSMSGFSPDRLVLAGIAAGVGTAADAVILCSEKLRKNVNYAGAQAALSELAGPLIAGAATTIAALLPLSSIEDGISRIIACAIAVVTITALILSLTLLPPLLLWGINLVKKPIPYKRIYCLSPHFSLRRLLQKLSRKFCRLLAANINFCTRRPLLILSCGLILTAAAIFALFARGVDIAGYGSEDSVYAQVEFDGGLLAEEIDRLLTAYGEKLASNTGIKYVETGARTGSGSLLVSFDPKFTQAHFVRELAKQIPIPGGFVFFHENSAKDRFWEINIYGDEDKKCREIAGELARLCAGNPLIRECVLNFKQGSKKMILLPEREYFAESKIGYYNTASRIRLGVYGPVIYKKMDSKGETDVRIRTNGEYNFSGGVTPNNIIHQSREGTLGILVSGGDEKRNSVLRVDSLMKSREEIEPASIRRTDRRRTASITVTTKPIDPRRVNQELAGVFKKLDLPPGYSVEFDPIAIKQAHALSATVISLIMAVIFCYMIIASINESFTVPLLVLSAIPPSLAIPALCLVLSGSSYNSAVACAFIAVSGMTVNASVLCVDSLRLQMRVKNIKNSLCIYLALRRKTSALLATTITTIAGAVPFLFLTESANTLIRTLSLVGALGVSCSFICSITVIPSLLFIFKKFLKEIPKNSRFLEVS